MTRPMLQGVKVIDLSRLLPGPFCSMILSDLGCEVIKIEEPGIGDYGRHLIPGFFESINRNKKSLSLNLRQERGREIFYRLCEDADIIIESFRPGVTQKLQIDYDTIKKIKPDIIYCSITGYGQDGPYKHLPGHDLNYLGVSGALAISGDPKGPPSLATTMGVADLSGSLFAVISILSALLAKNLNKEGVYIDLSITDSVAMLMAPNVSQYLSANHPSKAQMMQIGAYGVYKTKDEKYISIACIEDKFFFNLCRALGFGDMAKDPRFSTVELRNQMYAEIDERLKNVMMSRDLAEWLDYLAAYDIPCAPVYDKLDQILEDQHLKFRDIFEFLEDCQGMQCLFPAKFSGLTPKMKSAPPALGQHTDEILSGLGYSNYDINMFRKENIV